MRKIILATIFLGLLLSSFYVIADPQGVQIVSNTTSIPAANSIENITTAGGSFTTLVLNGSFQNPRWKAFVGNITGTLTLDDAAAGTIYDWDLTVITGEVYASRTSSVTWANIACADNTTLATEETAINFDTMSVDSVNQTFSNKIHKGFQVAGVSIGNSTCRAIATYVNDVAQAADENADFQEVLLDDDSYLIYTGVLEQDATGYDGSSTFDFQIIVPDDETQGTDTTYYFYAEIG